MKDFRVKVQKAVESMGNGPYDDKKTIEYATEASRRTTKYCEELKGRKIKTLSDISNNG